MVAPSTETSTALEPAVPAAQATPSLPFKFGTPVGTMFRDPERYDPDADLAAAVRVALLLGMPLLLTGEPGCGKTSVGYWLAWKLHLQDPAVFPEPLVFNVKSTTTGRDLLYEFDELARFRDAQARRDTSDTKYVRLNALGLGILYSGDERSHAAMTLFARPPSFDPSVAGAAPLAAQSPGDWAHFGRRHVVLIDELDKAPRDTPNDLLLEIDEMCFRLSQLDLWVNGDPSRRPVVIITSNSEKSLPEPFLRRCVFHHIRPPDDARRRQIVNTRRHPLEKRAELFDESMTLFAQIQKELSRQPGTAEMLAWLTLLEEAASRPGAAPTTLKGLGALKPTLGALAKTQEDIERASIALARQGLE